jgi:hypothetical protein
MSGAPKHVRITKALDSRTEEMRIPRNTLIYEQAEGEERLGAAGV